jgi:hypothetical protein
MAAGTPASKLCSPRESVLATTFALARARSPGRCSPGLSSPLTSAPAVRGFGIRANVPGRDEPVPRALSRARRLATRACQVRAPAVGSRTHGPSVRAVDQTTPTTVGQRPSPHVLSRSAHVPVASFFPREIPENEACRPRPLSAAPHASRVLRPRTATRGDAGGPRRRSGFGLLVGHLSRGGPTLLGFCPSSSLLVSMSCQRCAG